MTLEEKIRIIEEKIANLPTTFTEEEKEIIINNTRLFNLIKNKLLTEPNLCTEKVLDCIPDEVKSTYTPDELSQVYTYYVDNLLSQKIHSSQEIIEAADAIGLKKEDIERYKKIIHEGFSNLNYTIDQFNISEETILEMLEYKRYDLISQIKRYDIPNSIAEKIWEEYPFDSMPFPRILASCKEFSINHLEEYPLQETLLFYLYYMLEVGYGFVNEKKEAAQKLSSFIKIVTKKIKDIETYDLTEIKSMINYFNVVTPDDYAQNLIANEETINDVMEIALFFFKNGIYEITKNLYENNKITIEELKQTMIKLVKDKDYETFEQMSTLCFQTELSKDKEFANFLFENGFVESATHINFEIFREKKEYFISELRKGNETFRKYCQNIDYRGDEFLYDEEILEEMLKSGFVKLFSISSYTRLSEEKTAFLKRRMEEYPNINFNLNNLESEDFKKLIDTLLKTNRTNSIINYFISNSYCKFEELVIEANKTQLITNLIKTDFEKGLKLFTSQAHNILKIPELMDIYYSNDIYTKKILEYINHHENLSFYYNDENYERIKGYLSRKHNLPLENLDRINKVFGPLLIRYIDNENVIELAKLQPEELDRVIALFPKTEYTMQDLQAAYDSLKQYEYSKRYDKEIQVFPSLLHAIEDNDNELIDSIIVKISTQLDDTLFKRLEKKYDLPPEFTKDNLIYLVKFVVEKIKITTGDKHKKYCEILHEMTDYYIAKKREAYRDTYNMEVELYLPYDLEQKSLENVTAKNIIMYSRAKPKLHEYLCQQLEEAGIPHQIAEESIDYFINKNIDKCSDFNQVKKTIPKLINIAKKVIIESNRPYFHNNIMRHDEVRRIIYGANELGQIKRNYYIPKDDEFNIYTILTQLNIEALKKGVLSNEEIYTSLLNTIQKRKIHLLPNNLKNILTSQYINISSDFTNLAGFISYYGSIYDKVKSTLESTGKNADNIMLNITNILIYAEVYSGLSSIYSQILGNEDAKLIKANPGPNNATSKLANNGRLKEAIELTEILFQKKEVTIPTFNECLEISENKSLRVIAGNFTHPSNLTHGERTGACMRIGGAGETLFQFAINNPNGFHIRFEDPKTNEYISRVTGFRNGNTVFLNELRYSCNKEKYTDEDVVEACKKAAELLIELSKNSPCPIENVVIHKEYATKTMKEDMIKLGVESIKEGLPKFYTDIGSSAIVLATTAKDKDFVPLNFDKTNVPTYLPARENVVECKTLQEASGRINRIASIKRMLAGENYEYIEPYNFKTGFLYGIVNEDWYVYVDETGQIIKDVIDIDPRAKEELAQAIIEIENNLAKICEANQEVKYGL